MAPLTVQASAAGIVGVSGKNPAYLCNNCHLGGTTPMVTLSGPDVLLPNEYIPFHSATINRKRNDLRGWSQWRW
jgi:hypothetical protein